MILDKDIVICFGNGTCQRLFLVVSNTHEIKCDNISVMLRAGTVEFWDELSYLRKPSEAPFLSSGF